MELKCPSLYLNSAEQAPLLIVPYGIEMGKSLLIWSIFAALLIVPYGIEIELNYCFIVSLLSFNRTLWN